MATLTILSVLALAVLLGYLLTSHMFMQAKLPHPAIESFGHVSGRGEQQKYDLSIRRFKIKVEEDVLIDLKNKLNETVFFDSLPGSNFNYGVNDQFTRKLRDYWMNVYDWRKWESMLNQFEHYKTNLAGLDVHFLRAEPPKSAQQPAAPYVLLLHGWPGSVFEFYKILPLLTNPRAAESAKASDLAFKVVAPSIPGFGWSDKPQQAGFSPVAAAKIFGQLMIDRLNITEFYCQGGDWGSIICTYMAEMFPNNILGVHLNMARAPAQYTAVWVKTVLGYVVPSLIFDKPDIDYRKMYPFWEKFLDLLQESGYFHIQSTKPDTTGFALLNSPMGLAAYILEKFSTWTDSSFRNLKDGNLAKGPFSMDELITNVMIYYTTQTIVSSQRFYKEFFNDPLTTLYDKAQVHVPVGVAAFPNEPLTTQPRSLLAYKYTKIVSYDDMPRGGHFAALEEPRLLAESLFRFVRIVEDSRPRFT